jgi:hypothetical protein
MVSFTPRPLYPRRKGTRYPLYRRLGGPQSRSGQHGKEKILDPTGTDPSVVQPIASGNTDYATSAQKTKVTNKQSKTRKDEKIKKFK